MDEMDNAWIGESIAETIHKWRDKMDDGELADQIIQNLAASGYIIAKSAPTRDEFIDGYMQRSDIDAKHRTSVGFTVDDRQYVAVSCDCGEDSCDGWAMLEEKHLPWHLGRFMRGELPIA